MGHLLPDRDFKMLSINIIDLNLIRKEVYN